MGVYRVFFLLFLSITAFLRMMTRAFGRDANCDNQSSDVVLRGEINCLLCP